MIFLFKLLILGQIITFTFDDGVIEKYTSKVVNVLDEYKIRGTFFVKGTFIRDNNIYLKNISMKHEIGNHGYFHLSSTKVSKKRQRIEVLRAFRLFTGLKLSVKYYRPPNGKLSRFTSKLVKKHGMKIVLWDIDSNDIECFSRKGNCKKYVYKRLHVQIFRMLKSGIILMHDMMPWSSYVLRRILQDIHKNNCKLVNFIHIVSLSEYYRYMKMNMIEKFLYRVINQVMFFHKNCRGI